MAADATERDSRIVKAVADYTARDGRELSLVKGDLVILLNIAQNGWARGKLGAQVGYFPMKYVSEVRLAELKSSLEDDTPPEPAPAPAPAIRPALSTPMSMSPRRTTFATPAPIDQDYAMGCGSCGADLVQGAQFCSKCGVKVAPDYVSCRQCSTELMLGAQYCPKCGTKVGNPDHVSCPSCDASVIADSRFCFSCGTSMTTPAGSGAMVASSSAAASSPMSVSGTTGRKRMMRANATYAARDGREISLRAGDVITLLSPVIQNGWARGQLGSQVGFFPLSFTTEIKDAKVTFGGASDASWAPSSSVPMSMSPAMMSPMPLSPRSGAIGTYRPMTATSPRSMSPMAARSGTRVMRAMASYAARDGREISFRAGDNIVLMDNVVQNGWGRGKIGSQVGFFPIAYVRELPAGSW